jgi:hypothetical protein
MSKLAAIDFAVRRQLAQDGNAPPASYKEVLGANPVAPVANPAAAAANPGGVVFYGYTESSIATFLFELANRLRQDEPPLDFPWADQDWKKCLQLNLAAFEDLIARKTTIIQK